MLIGAQTVFNKIPIRFRGGSTVSDTRGAFGASGSARGRFFGGVHPTSGTPVGYTPPASWVIAQRGGGAGATSGVVGSGGVTSANLAGGMAVAADLSGSGGITSAALALVLSAAAALSGSGTLSAPVVGLLNAAAAMSGGGDAVGAVNALAAAGAALVGSGGVSSAAVVATAEASAAIVVTGDLLTTANIADAVLDAPDGVEPGLTLREALRLIAAATAGKVSGASGTTITIRAALADHRNRIVATVDADGNRTAITTDLT